MQETSTSFTAKRVNPYILFFILAAVLYLPSAIMRGVFYPDEARDLFIAKNMHTLNNFLFPHYLGGIYYQKPPLYFWILNLAARAHLTNFLFLPVLFNTLVAFAILSTNYLLLKNEGTPETGILSSILLSTTVIFYGMSIIVRMDILFLLFILLSVYFLLSFIKEARAYQFFLSGLFIFLSVFTKGAFGIIFPLFLGIGAALYSKRKYALLRALLSNGLGILLIIVWIASFSYINHSYIEHMVLRQTLDRGIAPFSHSHPLYYYLMFLIPLFLPWSFIGFGYFLSLRKHAFSLWEKLFMLWFIGGFLILSLVRSKMPMYLLILSVPVAGLSAEFLREGSKKHKLLLLRISAISFPAILISASIYFIVKNQFIPSSAYLVIALFVVPAALALNKSFKYKFEAFFIVWLMFIQFINFDYLPLASRHYDYNNIAAFLEKSGSSISKIYVDEKKLLLLGIYPLKAKVAYIKNAESGNFKRGNVFISRDEKPPNFRAAAKIGRFFIFYHTG